MVDATEALYLQRMETLARRDALTGLHAKHHFDALLEDALRSAREESISLAVWMLDLDGLKAINDQYGHRMGAATIRQVGGLLGEHLDEQSAATRFGGDEFCVYQLRHDAEQAREVAESFRQKIEAQTFHLDDLKVVVSVSIGVALLSPEITKPEQLVEFADRALYAAKESGRNRVEVMGNVTR
jgi:diguanylate cyclase (GGDEF)-like protein